MNGREFAGTGEVFRFTLKQYLKAKSTLVSMIVLLIGLMGAVFIASYSTQGGTGDLSVQQVALVNRTGIPVSVEEIAAADEGLQGLTETGLDQAQAVITLGKDAAGYWISARGEGLSSDDQTALETAAMTAFNAARLGSRGFSGRAMTLTEYLNPDTQKEPTQFSARFTLAYVYAMVLMMLVMFSSGYIIRSVLEEKASRLVETLLVSVRPMALILGKVLAGMCLVVGQVCLLALGGWGALNLAKVFLGHTDLARMLAQTGVLSALSHLNAGAIGVFAVSMLLGFFSFALLGGLSGACCSRMEDMGSANTAVVFITLAAYLASVLASAFEGVPVVVCSLIPFVSVFTAPVKFLGGEISFWIVGASWVLQAAVAAGLALLCRRVYPRLILQNGARVKWTQLIKMAKGGEGA